MTEIQNSDDQPDTASADKSEDAHNVDEGCNPKEIGGRKGPEPTRYGDWEKNGIISDF